jgi:hypothetical protein
MSELIGSLISLLTSQGSSLEIHQARVRLWGTGKNHTMRFLIVAAASVSALAFASGATAQQAPTPSIPPSAPATSQDDTARQHSQWFTEPNTYKPCPASVVLADGRHICLGCPTACRAHY